MATLQRSKVSYRREGSSGSVWGEKLVPELLILEQDRIDPNELRHSYSVGGPSMLMSKNHHHHHHHQSHSSSMSKDHATASLDSSPPAYMPRSSSLSASALKLLNPKSVLGVGKKFRVGAGKPPKYEKQFPLVVRV